MKTTVCLYRLIDSKTNALTLDHLKNFLSKNLVGKLVRANNITITPIKFA